MKQAFSIHGRRMKFRALRASLKITHSNDDGINTGKEKPHYEPFLEIVPTSEMELPFSLVSVPIEASSIRGASHVFRRGDSLEEAFTTSSFFSIRPRLSIEPSAAIRSKVPRQTGWSS
jgi:hypothetical protein